MKDIKNPMAGRIAELSDPSNVFKALADGRNLVDFRKASVERATRDLSDSFKPEATKVFEDCVNNAIQQALMQMADSLPISACGDRLFESLGFRNLIEFGHAVMKQLDAKKGE